jgi:hypothetical protein
MANFWYTIELRTLYFFAKDGNIINTDLIGVYPLYHIPLDIPADNPTKYHHLGVKKPGLKKCYIAIKYFQQAINLGNKTKDVYYNLGVAQYFYGETIKACQSWLSAVQLGDEEA